MAWGAAAAAGSMSGQIISVGMSFATRRSMSGGSGASPGWFRPAHQIRAASAVSKANPWRKEVSLPKFRLAGITLPMVRRLPVIQNNASTPSSSLGRVKGTASLLAVAGFGWAALLWGFAEFGFSTIAASCFVACAFAGATVGSGIAPAARRQIFALATAGFTGVVVLIAALGRSVPAAAVMGAAFVVVLMLSGAGFFVGGWLLTFRR
jgi:hypothetical protein